MFYFEIKIDWKELWERTFLMIITLSLLVILSYSFLQIMMILTMLIKQQLTADSLTLLVWKSAISFLFVAQYVETNPL